MLSTYTYPKFAYRRPAELDRAGKGDRHPVVVVGAGPIGLAAAIDLAMQGQRVLLLDDDDTVSDADQVRVVVLQAWNDFDDHSS